MSQIAPKPSKDITELLRIMEALRTPVTGCPWDLEQDFASIVPYTIEEAYEVAEAIRIGDKVELKEELGDLLLQVVYHAQMAQEEGSFDFGDVVEAITRKMIGRHPHVFGSAEERTRGLEKGAWDRIKSAEKAQKAAERLALGIPAPEKQFLDDVPASFPALLEAEKLQRQAARVGFDWGAAAPVLAKIKEEISELEAELHAGEIAREAMEDELGDVLFAVANLARHLDILPEAALKRTNDKFRRRFAHIEAGAQQEGRPLDDLSLEEMEAYWQAAKAFDPKRQAHKR
ncbi:nucleoside triphosphate pyrophosphohydrolase [Polycladidibacter hongkongensis]|uniref:nucleoside triphosphate pyrophosphohydrolase n=1 Tax=Polycladidibacter hongkongensis TaxID=1647556 RepID=UPI00083716D1|nr:nucleoside triphosphate pyrophosphohydrolase [Pseudovibrio hongkongensis]